MSDLVKRLRDTNARVVVDAEGHMRDPDRFAAADRIERLGAFVERVEAAYEVTRSGEWRECDDFEANIRDALSQLETEALRALEAE